MLINILLLTFLGSIISLFGGLILLLRKSLSTSFTLKLTSFAAGVLLGTALLDLFPEALKYANQTGGNDIFMPALLSITMFFLLERTLLWFHHHHEAHGIKPTVWMVTFGDSLHNFIDGVAISAMYIVNPAIGLTTALAVAIHEIPQEIADFSILWSSGLSKKQTILFNLISALTAFAGAISMYFFANQLKLYLGFIISFTAGMFIYIALSDLIPELHHSGNQKDSFSQILAFILGLLIVILVKSSIGE